MASRHLNITRGNIVYAEFPEYEGRSHANRKYNTEFGFLENRPLLVISNPLYVFDTISVIPLTTRNRPGFKVTIPGRDGINKESVIEAWSIHTFSASRVVSVEGSIDPYTMEAVTEAMKFHLGMSNVIPPYLDGSRALFKPSINSVKNGAEIASEYNELLEGLKAQYELGYTKPIPKKKETPVENEAEGVQETLPIPEVKPTKTKNERKWSTLEQILEHLTTDDGCKILARTMKDTEFVKKYNTWRPQGDIRKLLIERWGSVDDLNNVLKGKIRNWSALNQYQMIIVAAYTDISKIEMSDKSLLIKYINNVRKRHNIDKTDGRKWRELKESNKMMSI